MGLKLFNFDLLIQPFCIIIITALSLVLPLSFLLVARLSSAAYLFYFASYSQTSSSSLFFSIFLYTNPTLLHAFLTIITSSTLIYELTGRILLTVQFPNPNFRLGLLSSWILLCTPQLYVGLGVEVSIAAKIDWFADHYKSSLVNRVIFFIGLHETMLHWSRIVVHPMVDDTIFNGGREEKWVEKAVMAASFGGLWWWRLWQEMEALVGLVDAKVEIGIGVWAADFAIWWLYYVTVTIGMVKLVNEALSFSMFIFCSRVEENINGPCYMDEGKV